MSLNASPEEAPPPHLVQVHPQPGSLEKGLTLLAALSTAHQPMSLAELARRTGLPKTTAYRLLAVLCRQGFAQRIGIDYAAGDHLAALAGAGPRMTAGTRRLVLPYIVRLHELTRQTVNLAVPRGLEVAYVERVYGHGRVNSPSDAADRAPLYCTATGKVLLAFSHDLNADLRDRGTPQKLTRRTIVGSAALDRELCAVRSRGVAYSREEFAEGVVCTAAPVFGADGKVRMAVGVAGPPSAAASAEVTDLVRRTAQAISATLVKALPRTTGNANAQGR
ncbi:IclR family transcriptional regulator [Sphaerisporangium perillae]|uniref:IclR family transcriptional regulator n=1 Tax=Sphaerisporangium perillae TaxID=2935860 RepID=UPI00200D3FD8|nr:IclR family transcriptional regulator [Sphaerisporangium perillae]